LYSLGAFSTICKIQRNDAENRIRAMLKGGFLKPSQVALSCKRRGFCHVYTTRGLGGTAPCNCAGTFNESREGILHH
jgi:hypothetical protein